MLDDQSLFVWIRYYAAVVLLCLLGGAIAGGLYAGLLPRRHSAATIVVESGTSIGPRQLGPVAETVFASADVYAPAMRDLALSLPPREFLERIAELRPVPETNLLLVIGRAGNLRRAEAISEVMAASLVKALNDQTESEDFRIFSGPDPTSLGEGTSAGVAFVISALVGFWSGVAGSIIHFRFRRPVLTFDRALGLSGAGRATFVDGKWPGWLGPLRPTLEWSYTPGNRMRLERLKRPGDPPTVRVEVVGCRDKQATRLAYRVTLHMDTKDRETMAHAGGLGVIVANAGAGERELKMAGLSLARSNAGSSDAGLALLWIR
jgi:hypothetical protein